MNVGVMLQKTDVEKAFRYEGLSETDILLSIIQPNEMRLVETFMKHKAQAMLYLEAADPIVLVDMAKQSMLILDTDQVYLRVERPSDSMSNRALGDFINLLAIETKAFLRIAAPASHFLRRDSLASNGIELAARLGFHAEPLFLFSDAAESLSVFDDRQFLAWLRKYEHAEFGIQFLQLGSKPVRTYEVIDSWMRKTWFRGIDAYLWHLQRVADEERKRLPAGVIAVATATENHTSIFSDSLCRTVVAKINKNEYVYVIDYIDEKVARTLEDGYIRRNQFDIVPV